MNAADSMSIGLVVVATLCWIGRSLKAQDLAPQFLASPPLSVLVDYRFGWLAIVFAVLVQLSLGSFFSR